MKIELSKIDKNPYRDFNVHPIDYEVVEGISASISDLKFWGGISVRKVGDRYQQAFGHHRLEAMKLAGMTSADFTVTKYTDDEMAKALVMENATQQGGSPTSALDSIKVANLSIGLHLMLDDKKRMNNYSDVFESQASFANAGAKFKQGKGLGIHVIYRFSNKTMSLVEIRTALTAFEESSLLSSTMLEIHEKIDSIVGEQELAGLDTSNAERASGEMLNMITQMADPTFDYTVVRLFDRDSHAEAFRKAITSPNGLQFIEVDSQYDVAEALIEDLGKKEKNVTSENIRLGVSAAISKAAGMQAKIKREQAVADATSALTELSNAVTRVIKKAERVEGYLDNGVLPNISAEKASDFVNHSRYAASKLNDICNDVNELTGNKVVAVQ